MTKDFEVYFQGLYDEARDILVQRQAQYGPANIESLAIPGVFSRLSDDSLIPSTALIHAKPSSPRVKPLVCGRGAARFIFMAAE
jgi:hypothetical protein